MASIGNSYGFRSCGSQMAHGNFSHFPGAHNQNALGVEVIKNLARQLHRRGADRYRIFSDGCFRPHAFGGAEGRLQNAVQIGSDRAGFRREAVCSLHLTENLGLSQDHRVE